MCFEVITIAHDVIDNCKRMPILHWLVLQVKVSSESGHELLVRVVYVVFEITLLAYGTIFVYLLFCHACRRQFAEHFMK